MERIEKMFPKSGWLLPSPLAVLLLMTVWITAPMPQLLWAQENDSQTTIDDLGEDFWERYTDVADWLTLRLKLTPEQEAEVLPLLEKSFELKLLLLDDYGMKNGKMPKLTDQQKEELDAGMIGIRAAERGELVKMLDKQQLEEWKKVQREFHQAFREWLAKH